MNCSRHPEAPAVNTCAVCGAGICKNCIDELHWEIDGKPLCHKCSVEKVTAIVEDLKSKKRKSKSKIGLISVTFIVGFIIICINPNYAIVSAILWTIGGFSSVMSFFYSKPKPSSSNEIIVTVEYDEGLWPILKLIIALVFTFALAPIVSILMLIKNLMSIRDFNKKILENESILAQLKSIPD